MTTQTKPRQTKAIDFNIYKQELSIHLNEI